VRNLQSLQLRERIQVNQPNARHQSETEVQYLQLRKRSQVNQPGVRIIGE
jgi:hypothetical protein